MTEAWGIVVAALVTGSFGVLGLFLRRFRDENQRDHAGVASKLRGLGRFLAEIKVSVDNNGDRLSDHLDWHVTDKKPTRRKPAAKK